MHDELWSIYRNSTKTESSIQNTQRQNQQIEPKKNTTPTQSADDSQKTVYLTFDNGGPMGDTDKLLKTLKDNQGSEDNIEALDRIIKEIKKRRI